MDSHFLTRHLSAKVVVALLPLNIERGIQKMKTTTISIDLAKNSFSDTRCIWARQGRSTQAIEACPEVELLCRPGTVFDWHGSLWQRTSLGEEAGRIWAHGQVDGPPVREALCQNEQERDGRCEGDLRSRWQPEQAVCCDKDRRATSALNKARLLEAVVEGNLVALEGKALAAHATDFRHELASWFINCAPTLVVITQGV